MNRSKLAVAFALAASVWTSVATAQEIRRPTVSPYLNLNQRFRSPALNYYNEVRPQIAFRNAIGQLQQNEQVDQQTIFDLQSGADGLPTTGHAVGFLTHQRYFGTLGARQRDVSRSLFRAPVATPARSRFSNSTGISRP